MIIKKILLPHALFLVKQFMRKDKGFGPEKEKGGPIRREPFLARTFLLLDKALFLC
jgi:hypothetical protein